MLFDTLAAAQTAAEAAQEAVGVAFPFDWEQDAYPMEAGSPAEVTGVEAVKTWFQLVLRTRRGRYAIYPADFGCSTLDLIGKKMPRGYRLSELRRELAESAVYCPVIRDISTLVYNGTAIECTVTLDMDGTEQTEVIEIEP